MPPPVMTKQLAQRIQQVNNRLAIASKKCSQKLPGNPYDISFRQFGSATAYITRAIPIGGWWNRVIGFESETAAMIDEILSFFRPYQRQFYLDMNPTVLTEEIAQSLTERGLYPTPNGTVLYGLPQTKNNALPEGVEVREISHHEVDLALNLWADGFEFPPGPHQNTLKELRRGSFIIPDNHLYIAYVDGVPAAMAGLYINNGIGSLNVGATLPAYRKRGCHSALTARRITDAAKANCDLVIGDTGSFGSISQNNMERAGLRIAYTKLAWTKRSV